MIVYRLAKSKYAKDLSGRGAEIAGGRWNSKGVRMVYTSASRALCTTEIAVHTPLGNVPTDYYIISIKLPALKMLELTQAKLPSTWNAFPHDLATQRVGDLFVQNSKYLVMRVPSAVVQGDFNYLINPLHADFTKVKIVNTQTFNFDPRLFRK
jgi:RES domain-containing protein